MSETNDWVTIPIPPSANNLWRLIRGNSRQRVAKTKVYDSWLAPAVLLLRAGLPMRLQPPLKLSIVIVGGVGFNGGVRDLDNTIKATQDAIKKTGRIDDDTAEVISEISATYCPGVPGKPAECRVRLEELT